MSQRRFLFIIFFIMSIIVAGCGPFIIQLKPSTLGTAAQNIVVLVEQGTITFNITSGAINELGLSIQNTTSKPLIIEIPAGTYFVNLDSTSQNMVVRHRSVASIQPNGMAVIQLDAACANFHLTEPAQENKFTIQRTPESPLLTKIIDKLNSTKVDYPVEQAAIWIVTDDVTFDELGILVEGSRFGSSIINENDTLRAMMLVDEAGLHIRDYAIWEDRMQLISKATDVSLSTWMNNQIATQTSEDATQTIQEETPTP
jgi:hypothetical protein